ncbi:flagellar basal body rod protein [Metabacillus sp. 84]|uniref:lmo0954 family membrane protein n=1 Tax=Metabacillus sp. 84 TaxID=3404705 RepID=UPI003CEC1A20
MKKTGLVLAGVAAAIILMANTGHIIGLAISAVILYFAFKGFMKTDSAGKKVFWAIVGLIALSASAANLPAIFGLAALYVLIKIVRSLKETKQNPKAKTDDPFENFERQWADLTKSK